MLAFPGQAGHIEADKLYPLGISFIFCRFLSLNPSECSPSMRISPSSSSVDTPGVDVSPLSNIQSPATVSSAISDC